MLLDSVIGVVGFLLSAVGLIKDAEDQGSVGVSIWNGHDGKDLTGTAGGYPWIAVFGTGKELLGTYQNQNQRIENNAQITRDVKLKLNVEIWKVGLTMHSTDGICAAMISWKPTVNIPQAASRSGFIVGDLFYFCGRAWTYSGQKHDGVDLRCGWLDADNSAGSQSTKHADIFTDYLSTKNIQKYDWGRSNICDYGFGTRSASAANSPQKRASQHKARFGNQVHVSNHLSAVGLCDSETSWGASFYSTEEKIFCDMSTKTKIPLCENGNTTGCFNYISPRSTLGKSNQRHGSIQTPFGSQNFNVTYFVTRDFNGKIVDDGDGY